MNRTAWLAAVGGVALLTGLFSILRWPDSRPTLACDASDVRWLDGGLGPVAICAPELPTGPVPAGGARLLGTRFDLNQATEEELAEVPGIGPALAHALVEGRRARNGFRSWEEVDGVPGIGPAKLRLLQEISEIRR